MRITVPPILTRALLGAAFVRRLVLFARDLGAARPEAAYDAQQGDAAQDEDHQQRERVRGAPVKEVADREERRPDHRAARDPAEQSERDVVRTLDRRLGDSRLSPDRTP